MISAVSGFFPSSIGHTFPAVRQSIPLPQTQEFSKPANLPATGNRSSFADKLPITFSLSPSDFSSVFGVSENSTFFAALLPQIVSAAYSQSSVLTASKLSINV